MIRHLVLMRWKPDVTEEQRAATIAAIRRTPDYVPELRGYAVEENVGSDEGNHDLAIIAELDDLDGYAAYRDNEAHQALIRDVVRPVLTERVALQIEQR